MFPIWDQGIYSLIPVEADNPALPPSWRPDGAGLIAAIQERVLYAMIF